MKQSVNLSYTRKRRNPFRDMALFLQDIGLPKEEIIKAAVEVHKVQTKAAACPKCQSANTLPIFDMTGRDNDLICGECGWVWEETKQYQDPFELSKKLAQP